MTPNLLFARDYAMKCAKACDKAAHSPSRTNSQAHRAEAEKQLGHLAAELRFAAVKYHDPVPGDISATNAARTRCSATVLAIGAAMDRLASLPQGLSHSDFAARQAGLDAVKEDLTLSIASLLASIGQAGTDKDVPEAADMLAEGIRDVFDESFGQAWRRQREIAEAAAHESRNGSCYLVAAE